MKLYDRRMSRCLCIKSLLSLSLASTLLLAPTSSTADSGSGAYPREFDVLSATNAPALEVLGKDVVRFSSSPALGGKGIIIELHRRDADWAEGTMTLLYGHPSEKWEIKATISLAISASEFDKLTRKIDAEMSKGEQQAEGADGTIVVCTDGPGYVTERLAGDHSQWLSGSCGDHPNDRIAAMMAPLAAHSIDQWLPRFANTKRSR